MPIFFESPVDVELARSCPRILSIAALFWLYRRLRAADTSPKSSTAIPASCWSATGIFLAPVLVQGMGLEGNARDVFAAASLLVGLREELAYRGILQSFLTRRLGLGASLVVSNLLFIAYHFGTQPFTLHYVLQIFFVGFIIGLAYHLTGRLWFAAALHAVYDAIDSFSPFLTPPLPDYVCTVVFVSTLAVFLIANRRLLRAAATSGSRPN